MLQSHPEGSILHLYVQPGASKTETAGLYGNALKIRVQAPPVDGKANKALRAFLSGILSVPLSRIQLLKGETGRKKTVLIHGLPLQEAQTRLKDAATDIRTPPHTQKPAPGG